MNRTDMGRSMLRPYKKREEGVRRGRRVGSGEWRRGKRNDGRGKKRGRQAGAERQKARFVVGPSVFSTKPGQLPCGGGDGGDGFGFGELRDDAELLHKAQSVPVDPAFYHLAAGEAGDAYPGDGELLPRWRNPVEITSMGTPTRPTSHHCFAFGNEVLDRESKVGEGIAVETHSLLLTLGASPNIGRRTVMVSVSGCKELVCHRHIALVPNFFEQTTDGIFVLF